MLRPMPFHSHRLRGRVVELEHESRVLVGNPLGDRTQRSVFAYLPPSYDGTARFPVVMLLPGFLSNHVSFLSWSPFEKNVVEVFDEQIARGESEAAILVMPDATNRWGGSQFLDSPATGLYQTYLAEEVLGLVDRELRTLPVPEARAVCGKSSGGFGALRLALDRPDAVCAAGSHAGDADFEVSFRPMFTNAAIAAQRAGSLARFLEGVVKGGPRDAMGFDLLFVCAASAAYAAERDASELLARICFDVTSGLPVPDVFRTCLTHDPLTRVTTGPLPPLRGIFLDAGDRDEHGLQIAASKLRAALEARGAHVLHEVFEGGHRGTSHRYARSIPWLVALLARERATSLRPV
jgi:pimeloyl-ACP methyl ester carboxylesterase